MSRMQLFYIFLTSMFSSLVLIPSISRLAISIGIFDATDDRKVHKGAIPRLGGIAIFFSVLLAVILFSEIGPELRGFLAGAIVIFLTGLTDDLEQISPKKKLMGQCVAALIATVVGGLQLTNLGNLFGTGVIPLGYFSIPFTIFAIVGMTNAVNLLDGLDGLAGGVSAIAASSIGVLAYLSGNFELVGVCVALLGGVTGFLKFNSYPARIFMGDGGSLFLGYCLATMSVHLVEHSHGQNSVITPLIILAVPVFDTLFVMGKRLISGKGIFQPDRTHIHHRFMGIGLGHKATVILVYGLSYFLAVYAVLFRSLSDQLQLVNMVLLLSLFCFMNWVLTRFMVSNRDRFVRGYDAVRNVYAYRWRVRCSQYLLGAVKYLLVAVMVVTVASFPVHLSFESAMAAALFIMLTFVLYVQTGDVNNAFLQVIMGFNAAFILFLAENNAHPAAFTASELRSFSASLFAILFGCTIALLVLRNKSKAIIDSPLEYFILFAAIALPLLPVSLTKPLHLLTVAGKSLVLFLSFKMTFLLSLRRNTSLSSFFRYLLMPKSFKKNGSV